MNELDDMLTTILNEQHKLQFKLGYDTESMTDEEKIAYITWNNHAAAGELSEMMMEIGWKPWATSRHINRNELIEEGVDVLKFLLNQMLAVGVTPDELYTAFINKTVTNYERQAAGYTGRKNIA